MGKFFFIVLFTTIITGCTNNCYLSNQICKGDVDYSGEPKIDLFYKRDNYKKNIFSPITPPGNVIGFYVSAKEINNTLYIVFQNYEDSLNCVKKPYIENLDVNYKLKIYYISNLNGKLSNLKLIEDNLPKEIEIWKENMQPDTTRKLVCEDGKVTYGSWSRKF